MDTITRIKYLDKQIEEETHPELLSILKSLKEELRVEAMFEDVPETYTAEEYCKRIKALRTCIKATATQFLDVSEQLSETYFKVWNSEWRRQFIRKED